MIETHRVHEISFFLSKGKIETVFVASKICIQFWPIMAKTCFSSSQKSILHGEVGQEADDGNQPWQSRGLAGRMEMDRCSIVTHF